MPESRAAEENKLKVFISYSRKDLAFAQLLVAALEARGLAPSIDTRDQPDLEDWRRELLDFIRNSDTVLFIVSPRSVGSSVCAWEVSQVAAFKKRLAPIVLERVDDDKIPQEIAKINYLFFDPPNDFEEQANRLAKALLTDAAICCPVPISNTYAASSVSSSWDGGRIVAGSRNEDAAPLWRWVRSSDPQITAAKTTVREGP